MSEPYSKHDYTFGYKNEVLVSSTHPLPEWATTALKVHFSLRNEPDPQLKFPFMEEPEGPNISRMEKPTFCKTTGKIACPVCGVYTDGGVHENPRGEKCSSVYGRRGWRTLGEYDG